MTVMDDSGNVSMVPPEEAVDVALFPPVQVTARANSHTNTEQKQNAEREKAAHMAANATS